MFRRLCRYLAMPMAVLIFLVQGPLPSAQAALVTTDQVMEMDDTTAADRAEIMSLLQRSDVREQFAAWGVAPEEAEKRVQALSDAEVRDLASRLEDAKAGQGAVGAFIGAALIVFLVLLVTDILCLTSVFNFTRCAANNN